jgi:hypothetical protein
MTIWFNKKIGIKNKKISKSISISYHINILKNFNATQMELRKEERKINALILV